MNTLPANWTGNTADHHADIGAFRVVVRRLSKQDQRWRWEIRIGRALTIQSLASAIKGDPLGEASPELARSAAMARLHALVVEVVASAIMVDAGFAVEDESLSLLRRVFTSYRGKMVSPPGDAACARCCQEQHLCDDLVEPGWRCSYHEATQRLGIVTGGPIVVTDG